MKNLTLAVVILIGITGCQSTPEEPTTVQTNAQENNVYEQSTETYNTWLKAITESKKLKFYSSDLYNDLLTSWEASIDIYDDFSTNPEKATEKYSFFSSDTYAEKFEEQLKKVKNNYEKLLKLKETANSTLAESISQLEYLNTINAAKLYSERYNIPKLNVF